MRFTYFSSFRCSRFPVTFIEVFTVLLNYIAIFIKTNLSNACGSISGDTILFYFSIFSNLTAIYTVIIIVVLWWILKSCCLRVLIFFFFPYHVQAKCFAFVRQLWNQHVKFCRCPIILNYSHTNVKKQCNAIMSNFIVILISSI